MSRAMTFRQRIAKTLFPILTLLLFGWSLTVSAATIFASDCSFGFKNVFFDNEPVCAAGSGQLGVFDSAQVCVVPPGGGPGDDVTAGGCNTIGFGASIYEEFLWLPPLTPGNYEVAIFPTTGSLARDAITVLSSGGAPITIDVAGIKARAGQQAQSWEAQAAFGANLSDYATAFALAWAAATGDVLGVAVNAASLITGIPTDYNAGVLTIGGKIINIVSTIQALRYRSLEADPPDPNFTVFATLDFTGLNADLAAQAALNPAVPTQYPFAPMSQDPLHLAQIAVANSQAMEAALVQSFISSIEKFQGAEDAGDPEFELLQARDVRDYANLIASQLGTTKSALQTYKAELAADGLADIVYDGADLAAIIDRLRTTGLTAAEEADLRSIGFQDTDLDLLIARANAFDAPAGSASRGSLIDDVIVEIDLTIPSFLDIATQAQAVIDDRAPGVTLVHPTADAGGPYTGNAGSPMSLDASGSTDPNGDIVSYEWDTDLDGVFDDALGVASTTVFPAPYLGMVALKVTDAAGNEDIAFASISIAAVNGPPVIDSFSPADLLPTASNSNPLLFEATASDPDLDPLVFEWTLDGAVMSTASSWLYTPGIGETGTRTVKLRVSDAIPATADAIEVRVVQLEAEVLVPDVTGQDQASAEADLIAAGLAVGNVTTASSDTVPAGDVISQNPAGGASVAPGTAVDLVVSAGPAPVLVPDVTGQDQASAEADLIAAGLAVGNVTTASSDTVPAGDVISQNPAGGASVAPGTAVDLVVSAGPAPVLVPDVTGQDQASAEADLIAAGLAVGNVTTASSDTVPAGDVISQNPAGGASVAPGTAIDLVVSSGPAAVEGDLDGDGDVDRDDVAIVLTGRGQPASGPDDPRDVTGDGLITVGDARALVLMCTRPNCATE